MLHFGLTPTTKTHERAHDNSDVLKPSDGIASDINPLIRQLLLARNTVDETPEWQHA